MQELVKIDSVNVEIEGTLLLEQVKAGVRKGEVIGLIGNNGAGKSTLLKLLNGDMAPSSGSITPLIQGLKTVMVEQEAMDHSRDALSPGEAVLLQKWDVPAGEYDQLSGGEKLKVRLARGIAQNAHLLLLDEPTNHLDEEGIGFLIRELKAYRGTVILVSHDRAFLDEVADVIWSIENKTIVMHEGNYSAYVKTSEQRRLTQQRAYEKQQKLIKRIEGQIQDLTSWSGKAHAQSTKQEFTKEFYRSKAKRMDAQVKSKRKRLEKEIERINADPVEVEEKKHLSVRAGRRAGKRLLEVKDLGKAHGSKVLFRGASFTIQNGERVAVTGANGSGKTTFLNMIMGNEAADEGELWLSPAAKIGYLTQEVFDLPLDETPENLFYRETFHDRGQVRNLMTYLGFGKSQWEEPIRHMSMGERVKCKLIKYILEDRDVLILDEPTNHLDLLSREQLEHTLAAYDGTLIVVSHDRYFLEKTTSSEIAIGNGKMVRKWEPAEPSKDEREELRMQLETERQEVLGKLSFMTPAQKEYAELDARFNELTKRIRDM
ncbi:ABC-F type ribosomal protection protein [Rossellomorea marisflavi]|uniref:ABC-F type ribosomal protection protein n=1 Tax=Rossellomorea marisflavi TaxID=189381 RepID=A0A5D4RQW9_9BACI|nr:ABC-F type ribosomal protection protein [Rossellomorea marisflavi]TYS53149.1 ABC-F type ribosomal protection protein [Rossellomorea marisflavi]